MRKQQWDEIFEALWDGTKRAGDGLATLSRKQKLELDNFARRVKDKDNELADGKYTYNMVDNPGPLDPKHAQNFAGGRYDVEVTTEDLVLFRGGNSQYATGSYWTDEPPMGEIQTRMDYAVEKYWLDADGNYPAPNGKATSLVDTGYAVLIPKGTTIYTGPVASHGGVLAGGGPDQIHIPWDTPGLTPLASWDLP